MGVIRIYPWFLDTFPTRPGFVSYGHVIGVQEEILDKRQSGSQVETELPQAASLDCWPKKYLTPRLLKLT